MPEILWIKPLSQEERKAVLYYSGKIPSFVAFKSLCNVDCSNCDKRYQCFTETTLLVVVDSAEQFVDLCSSVITVATVFAPEIEFGHETKITKEFFTESEIYHSEFRDWRLTKGDG